MKKVVLAILDGVGLRKDDEYNAFNQAIKPNFDYFLNEYPHSSLDASGQDVGLPKGQMGNSETGHLNIGAGRIVYQPLELINNKIETGVFFENKEFINLMEYSKNNNKKLHLIGLISDGGVHSHINHLKALLKMCNDNGISPYMHLITDGRDTLTDSGITYVKEIKNLGIGSVASIIGRYYTMDRDKNYDRTLKGYNLMVNGVGKKYENIEDAFNYNYSNNVYDEFIEPCLIDEDGLINEEDAVIWFNFRPDRAIQILTKLMNLTNHVVTMMPVAKEITCPSAFHLDELSNTLGEYLSKKNISQLRIAETEKYAHVTYFFDGGVDIKYDGCDRILIPSPKVPTYDLKPEMSAYKITDELLNKMNDYDVVILNFANCDMVGHTGNMESTIKAIEVVDYNLGRIYSKCRELGFTLFITADHGNCELMADDKDNVITSHTTSKVPFIICDKNVKLEDGRLGDVAPTILKYMGLDIPKEMTGKVILD